MIYNREIEPLSEGLLLISIETIILDSSFIFLIQRLINEDRLDRIIIDECHLLITSRSYRSIMYRIKEIFKYKVQFVLLSGTVPLYIEDQLQEEFPISSLSIIRGPTSRANISYNLRQYRSNEREEQFLEVKEYIEAYSLRFSGFEDKILIFCPSVAKVQALGRFLNYPIYYSSLDNKEEVLQLYLSKKESSFQALVSTSSLEEGIDYPSIRLVIYIDAIHSFIGLLQGSSRGGRDNRESSSTFFYQKGEEEDKEEEASNLDKCYIRKYIREQVCRRRIIDLFLDNTITDQCSNSISKCDLCLKRDTIQNSSISNLLSSNKDIQRERDVFKEIISRLSTFCIPCLLLRDDFFNNEHSFKDCSLYYELFSEEIQSIREKLRGNKRSLSKDSCCFRCFLPTITCFALKESNARQCFDDTLVPSFFILCLKYFKDIGLEERLRVASFKIWNHYSLERIFFKKTFMNQLNTESIEGISILEETIQAKLQGE